MANATNSDSKPETATTIAAPTEKPKQGATAHVGPTGIKVNWDKTIRYAQDPVLVGSPLAEHLVGHVVFLDGSKPIQGDGSLTVDLLEQPKDGTAPGILRQRWEIPSDTLQLMLDKNGTDLPSYSLVLPWTSYRPDFARIRVTVEFKPVTGEKLQVESDIITMEKPTEKDAGKPADKAVEVKQEMKH